jgi:ABC-type polysaccharide/polyol phosphate export permease
MVARTGAGAHHGVGVRAAHDRPGAPRRDLFVTLVERQVRLRAKRAWIGVLWPLLAPLLLLGLYIFVFHTVFKVPVPRYGVYLFSALLPWSLLAQSLGLAVTSISTEAEIIRRAPFPYELLPISNVATLSLYFLADLLGFVVYLALVGQLSWALAPLLVVPVVALCLFVMAVSIVLALVDVYNRDVRSLLGNLLTVWFFLVPVVYSPSMVSHRIRMLRSVDPMNMLVGQFRDILYYGHVSRPAHMVLVPFLCATVFVVSCGVFRRLGVDLPRDV